MFDYEKFCQKLPKCEFHARWEACMSLSMLDLLYRHLFDLPKLTDEERKLLRSYGKPQDFNQIIQLIKLIRKMILLPIDVSMVTADIIKQCYQDGVIYLELRVLPLKSNYMTYEEFLKEILKAVITAKNNYPRMTVKLLITIDLEQSPNEIEKFIDWAIAYKSVLADINDPESRIIRGFEVLANSNRNIYGLEDKLDAARTDANLITVYNCHLIPTAPDDFYHVLQLEPDRVSHVTVLQELKKIPAYSRMCIDRLIASRIPTGYSQSLGCTLSCEYFRMACELQLHPQQVFDLAILSSLYTRTLLTLTTEVQQPLYDPYYDFANEYGLHYNFERAFQLFDRCLTFIHRPLHIKQQRPLHRIVKERSPQRDRE